MSNQPKPRRYDRIGEWFLSKKAERLGLAFTIVFGLGCVPDIISTFAPVRNGKCSECRDKIREINRSFACE